MPREVLSNIATRANHREPDGIDLDVYGMRLASHSVMCAGYVLVIEDDAEIRTIVAEHLRRIYPDVREANDGADALALLEEAGPPAVVLTDIVMPGVLGTSIAEYLRVVDSANVPLAFVTGSPQLATAGHPVFTKPAKLSKLREFVGAHVPQR